MNLKYFRHSYAMAINGLNSLQWADAIQSELNSIEDNKVWSFVKLPAGRKALTAVWVFKVKALASGAVERFKARLAVRGFLQVAGTDFKDTFAPVATMTTIRILLVTAAALDMELYDVDVKTAFMHSPLDEKIYLEPPPGVDAPDGLVALLAKALPGLRQASRAFNLLFHKIVTGPKLGYKRSSADPCLYVKRTSDSLSILVVVVDDTAFADTSPNKREYHKLVKVLKETLKIHIRGMLTWWYGFEIIRDRKAHTIEISQEQLIDNMLVRFGMEECKAAPTPFVNILTKPMTLDELGPVVNSTTYRQQIGSLLFPSRISRPDIALPVNHCAKFSGKPHKVHDNAVKRIFRFLKGTKSQTLKLGGKLCTQQELFNSLRAFADSSHGDDYDTGHSTSGHIFLLLGPVCWSVKVAKTVSLSTAEAEYVQACEAAKTNTWLRAMLSDILSPAETPPTIVYEDNTACIRIAQNAGVFHKRTKHINLRYHYVREEIAALQLVLKQVPTEFQLADFLTKPLGKERLYFLLKNLFNPILDIDAFARAQ